MTADRSLTIFFNDGSKLSFRFSQQAQPHEVATRMEEFLKREHLKIEADGVLFIFPLTSVKYVQAAPVPAALGDEVIRGATIAE